MTAQQKRKQRIRAFMQEHYTDERLAMLLAHARDGKLSFHSCCCFIGVATAEHSLQGELPSDMVWTDGAQHLIGARVLDRYGAENAFRYLAGTDVARRRIVIPMIRAEMKRRENLQSQRSASVESSLSEQEVLS